MKDSGVEWLGEVPGHWEVLPNRSVFEEVKESGYPNERMLSVTILNGIIRQDDLLRESSNKDQSRIDKSAYKLVQQGDIAYNKMRAWQGAIGVSRYRGIVSPAYIVHRLLDRSTASSEYFHHLFRTPAFAKEAERCSYGITSDMWSLRSEDFKIIYSCVPPLPEQTAIVRFLDHAAGRIERQIRAKEKLITLLEEQKQVVVNDAVTGRIDVRTGRPYPEYKDSGVEWLGEVPGHWEVRRLKHWLLVNQLTLGEDTDPDFMFEYVEIGAVGTGRLVAPTQRIKFHGSPSRARRIVRNGDTIVSTVRTYLKAIWHISDVQSDLIVSTGFAVLTPTSSTCSKFVSYVCQSGSFTDRVSANSVGVAYPGIAESKFSAFEVAVPPLPEQTAIACYLDDAIANISSAIDRANREIELLREYRTRLIADVVTGKLDVREVAADLPEAAAPVGSGDLDAVFSDFEARDVGLRRDDNLTRDELYDEAINGDPAGVR